MSLDKAIQHKKERRKPYRGAAAWDSHCRNNNYCSWCRSDRTIQDRRNRIAADTQIDEFSKVQDLEAELKEYLDIINESN